MNPKQDVLGKWHLAATATYVIAAGLLVISSSFIHAQMDQKVSAGLGVWKTSGCADCHGPFADGDCDDDDFLIGANLRSTKLATEALRMTIRCGRHGRGMGASEGGAC